MFRQAVLTLDGTAQKLSDAVLGAADGSITIARRFQGNLSVDQVTLQANGANANPVFVGDAGVEASESGVWGIRIPVPETSVPAPPYLLENTDGDLKLDEVYVRGTSTQKVHITFVIHG